MRADAVEPVVHPLPSMTGGQLVAVVRAVCVCGKRVEGEARNSDVPKSKKAEIREEKILIKDQA